MTGWGIRNRLVMLALLPMSLVAFVLAFFFTSSQLEGMESAWRELARSAAHHLAASSEYAVVTGNLSLLKRLVDGAGKEPGVRFVVVVDEFGQELSSVGLVPAGFKSSKHLVGEASWQGGSVFSAVITLKPASIEDMYLESAREKPGERILGTVHVGVSDTAVRAAQRQMLQTALLIVLIGLLLASALAMLLSRTISNPLHRLSKVVSEVGKGNLEARVPADGGGEFLILQQGFNAMADTIQNAQAQLRRRILEATAEASAKKDEAERANRDKSRFLAAVSHDLRQPMHALGLFAAALKGQVSSPEQSRLARKIEDSILALEEMFDALLNLSRLDAGAIRPDVGPVELDPIFSRMGERFRPLAEEKGLKLRIRVCRGWAMSDALMLERMVSNLMANALRYTQRGGVLVGCRRRQSGVLLIQVWDTGIGIGREHLPHVFEEYYQVDNPARNRAQGMGLGLAIVGRTANLLGHEVAVRSRLARGTMFSITVPSAPPVALHERRTAVARIAGPFARQRVLIVDDDDSVRDSMRSLLISWGLRPVAVSDVHEALALMENMHAAPDALLCDYRLPTGSGIDAIRTMRGALGEDVPAAVISGDTAAESVSAILASGLPLLRKPVRPAKLRALLTGLLMADSGVVEKD